MSFPRYENYKDSGVEWLGGVPEHWEVRKLSSLSTKITNGYVGPTRDIFVDDGVPYLQSLHIKSNRIIFDVPYFVREEWSRQHQKSILQTGDVLIVQTGDIGQVAVVTDEFAGCNCHALIVVAPDSSIVNGEWLSLALNTAYGFHTLLSIQTGALHPHLNCGNVKDVFIPFPPASEQQTIATFLDRETAKIDTLITEQQQLIALLTEKRQAVISHAVTKGLNPDAPMKDSGIEWLGKVPEHWAVLSLGKMTIDKCDGPFGSGLKSEHYTDTGVRVIRLQNIRLSGFDDKDAAFIDENYYRKKLNEHDVRQGDVLIAGLGDDRNTVGRACVAPAEIEPAMVKADCFRFRLFSERALPEFVSTQLTAGSPADAGLLSSGSTRSRIPLSVMASRKIALPPIDEQKAIICFLQRESKKFDALALEAQKAITLLQERRTALISAAVTGKIDVRGALHQE